MSNSSLSIGLQALTTAQRAIEIAGSNIANANTPGYVRRAPSLRASPQQGGAGSVSGAGVTMDELSRVRDQLLDARISTQLAGLGDSEVTSQILREVEAFLNEPSDQGLASALTTFFNSLRSLSANADDPAVRLTVLEEAVTLAQRFTEIDGNIAAVQTDVATQIQQRISEINAIAERIAQINGEAQGPASQGQGPVDERDALVEQLSRFGKVTVNENAQGEYSLLLGGHALVSGQEAFDLEVVTNSGAREIRYAGGDVALDLGSGEVGALQTLQTETLASYRASLDGLAQSLIEGINNIHAAGVGTEGGFGRLQSANAIEDTSAPLADQALPFDIMAGEIVINVTNSATGEIEQRAIVIDPDADSLTDVATAIAAVPNLNTTVANGRLTFMSADGYTFDLTGNLDPTPSNLGTAAVTVSGTYTGSDNDVYTLTALGDGTIGATAGLQVEVRNADGDVLATLDVGDGYVPGTALGLGNGVSVALDVGNIGVSGPDTVGVRVTADPDTAGLWNALGVNTFFQGNCARDIAVSQGLLEAPERMACSRFNGSGDSSNILRMLSVESELRMADGTQTMATYYQSLVAQIGLDTQQAQSASETKQLLVDSLQNRRDEVSAVSIDEELLSLMKFQRAFESAARFVSVINELGDTLIRM